MKTFHRRWYFFIVANGLTCVKINSISELDFLCVFQPLNFEKGYMISSILYSECDQLSLLRLNIKHVSKRDPGCKSSSISSTHWGRDKMDVISQTTFWSAFSWMKIILFNTLLVFETSITKALPQPMLFYRQCNQIWSDTPQFILVIMIGTNVKVNVFENHISKLSISPHCKKSRSHCTPWFTHWKRKLCFNNIEKVVT